MGIELLDGLGKTLLSEAIAPILEDCLSKGDRIQDITEQIGVAKLTKFAITIKMELPSEIMIGIIISGKMGNHIPKGLLTVMNGTKTALVPAIIM